jgi:hypothetical protein
MHINPCPSTDHFLSRRVTGEIAAAALSLSKRAAY